MWSNNTQDTRVQDERTTSKEGEWKGTDGTVWEWKEREGRDGSVVGSKNFLKLHPWLRVQFHTASQVCCLRLPCSV